MTYMCRFTLLCLNHFSTVPAQVWVSSSRILQWGSPRTFVSMSNRLYTSRITTYKRHQLFLNFLTIFVVAVSSKFIWAPLPGPFPVVPLYPHIRSFTTIWGPFPSDWAILPPWASPVEGFRGSVRRLSSSTGVICMILKRSLPTHVIKSRVRKLKRNFGALCRIFAIICAYPGLKSCRRPCHMGLWVHPWHSSHMRHVALRCVAPYDDGQQRDCAQWQHPDYTVNSI